MLYKNATLVDTSDFAKETDLADLKSDCMLLSCHVRVSEWIHPLRLPECQGTPCSKQAG